MDRGKSTNYTFKGIGYLKPSLKSINLPLVIRKVGLRAGLNLWELPSECLLTLILFTRIGILWMDPTGVPGVRVFLKSIDGVLIGQREWAGMCIMKNF